MSEESLGPVTFASLVGLSWVVPSPRAAHNDGGSE
eukprot:CAMPEP_0194036430 /NCGR_PEP_ID=MMETSP0009_2-20130614/8771_1 /TAXON_ID=210454 /ORGANISM="Grammatophora oceanica, Strain CCMP 410" /LENGTH=34 /DNA_ID= /DNA_START= /DNA_END= /DNA_ORIENTATION=